MTRLARSREQLAAHAFALAARTAGERQGALLRFAAAALRGADPTDAGDALQLAADALAEAAGDEPAPGLFGASKPWATSCTLRVGAVEARVVELRQSLTYAGLLAGYPNARRNGELLRSLRASGALVLEPPRRGYLLAPGDLDGLEGRPFGPPELLPAIQVELALEGAARSREADFAALRVIGFQDTYALPLAPALAAALASLDWHAHAKDASS